MLWKQRLGLVLVFGLALLVGCGKNPLGSNPWNHPPVLEFPLADPSAVQHLAAFGTPNWSGSAPHNGIDLVLYQNLAKTRIVSPVSGTIRGITVQENSFSHPPNQMLMTVEIYVNMNWRINLVIEPSTVDTDFKNAQRNAIRVQVGQKVKVGDDIGDLLVGNLGYAHLHFMPTKAGTAVCAYDYSSDQAKAIFDAIAARSHTKYKY